MDTQNWPGEEAGWEYDICQDSERQTANTVRPENGKWLSRAEGFDLLGVGGPERGRRFKVIAETGEAGSGKDQVVGGRRVRLRWCWWQQIAPEELQVKNGFTFYKEKSQPQQRDNRENQLEKRRDWSREASQELLPKSQEQCWWSELREWRWEWKKR